VNGKEQKIMVVGDADWMSAQEINRYNIRVFNFLFMMEVFKWFSNDEYPVDVSRPKSVDNKLLVGKEAVSVQKIFFLGILPALMLAGAIWLLISRKRR